MLRHVVGGNDCPLTSIMLCSKARGNVVAIDHPVGHIQTVSTEGGQKGEQSVRDATRGIDAERGEGKG